MTAHWLQHAWTTRADTSTKETTSAMAVNAATATSAKTKALAEWVRDFKKPEQVLRFSTN